MTCSNCKSIPGKAIMVDNGRCIGCGRLIVSSNAVEVKSTKWDTYFYNLCKSVATKSPCLSRQIGAILVRDKSIISTGYNGPPRGIPHCGNNRWMNDRYLQQIVKEAEERGQFFDYKRFRDECPRRVFGYISGTHMELCPAQHAEENAVSNAARNGVSINECTLYMNAPIPCSNCFGTLINAGIVEIVIDDIVFYDIHTPFLKENSNIKIRQFNLGGTNG